MFAVRGFAVRGSRLAIRGSQFARSHVAGEGSMAIGEMSEMTQALATEWHATRSGECR
jgi:hypothetical protein